MRMVGVLLGLALATGCASSQQASNRTTQGQKEIYSSNSARSGIETGRLAATEGKRIMMEPYGQGGTRTFALGKDVPVFFGEGVPQTKTVAPGSDVRVFYRESAEGQPKVVALEVLNPQDAARLQGTQSGTQTTPQTVSPYGTQPTPETTPETTPEPTPDTNAPQGMDNQLSP